MSTNQTTVATGQEIQKGLENNLATILARVFETNNKDFENGIHSLGKVLDDSGKIGVKVSELERQNSDLRADLEKCKSDKVGLVGINEKLDKEITGLKEYITSLSGEIVRLDNYNTKLISLNTKLTTENALLTDDHTEITAENKRLKKENNEIKETFQNSKTQHSDLQTEINTLKLNLVEKTKELENKNKEIENLNETNKLKDKTITIQKNEIDTFSANQINYEAKINNLEEQLTERDRRISELETKLKECLEDKNLEQTLIKENTQLKHDIDDYKLQIYNLTQEFNNKNKSLITNLEQQKLVIQKLNEDVKTLISNHESELNDLKTELQTAKVANEKLTEKITQYNLDQRKQLGEMNKLINENESLKTQVESLTQSLKACTEKDPDSQAKQIVELQNEISKHNAEILELKNAHNEALTQQQSECQQKIENITGELKKIKTESETKNNSCSELENANKLGVTENLRLEAQIESLTAELANCKTLLNDFEEKAAIISKETKADLQQLKQDEEQIENNNNLINRAKFTLEQSDSDIPIIKYNNIDAMLDATNELMKTLSGGGDTVSPNEIELIDPKIDIDSITSGTKLTKYKHPESIKTIMNKLIENEKQASTTISKSNKRQPPLTPAENNEIDSYIKNLAESNKKLLNKLEKKNTELIQKKAKDQEQLKNDFSQEVTKIKNFLPTLVDKLNSVNSGTAQGNEIVTYANTPATNIDTITSNIQDLVAKTKKLYQQLNDCKATLSTPPPVTTTTAPSTSSPKTVDFTDLIKALKDSLPTIIKTSTASTSPSLPSTMDYTSKDFHENVIVEQSDKHITITHGPFIYDIEKQDPEPKITQSYYDGTKTPLITLYLTPDTTANKIGNIEYTKADDATKKIDKIEYTKADDATKKREDFTYNNINTIYEMKSNPNLAIEILDKFNPTNTSAIYKSAEEFRKFLEDIYIQYLSPITPKIV